MPFESLVENPWCASFGWTLLHSLWQGAAAAVALAMVMLATKSPRVRYAVGCFAMLAVFVAFVITLVHLAPHAATRSLATRPLPPPIWQRNIVREANSWTLSLATIAPWLAPFWFLGVVIFYLRYAAGLISLNRLSRRGVCAAPEIWQTKLANLKQQLRLSRPVVLLESALAGAPMLIGHLRPVILMPIGLLAGLPSAQVETILLHELAHVRRHDYLLNALQNMLDGFLFYHPAIWWISHTIRAEREKCCDDVVVTISGDAHQYARALTALEETRSFGRQPAVAAKGGSLMKRIRRLLYPSVPAVSWSPVIASSVLLLTAALTFGAWQQADPLRARVLQACPDSAHSSAKPMDYQKWLNEDVFYIIDDAEREAFQKLTTDDERGCFVYQFWERRNPTPGSDENKFKAEHYRRIAYANAHFASSVPGWQTDRGHMYIVYGPPDEIDAHPKATPHPYQSWGYSHVEGASGLSTFNFVDRTGHGDYHLAPSDGR
jgi:GWxTD domain-containing protein